MFAAQEAALRHWRVITWDARGHGGTADDGASFSYWDAARDLLGLMDALGIGTAAIGGVSQGGFIAMRAALLEPDRISSLVLFDTEAHACQPSDKAAYHQLFDALSERGPIEELTRPLAKQIIGDHPAAGTWIQKWREAGQLPLGAPARCLLDRDDIVARLTEIRCPALLVRGSEDTSLPQERLKVMREHLPGATSIQVIQGAAHSPPLTHPEEVNALLARFLSGGILTG
ncbi:MAG: alpha/beta hydrolase [Actinomycetia bacterium]|nr:alpha/beta hydrolase [Actinomycetes bacterium]